MAAASILSSCRARSGGWSFPLNGAVAGRVFGRCSPRGGWRYGGSPRSPTLRHHCFTPEIRGGEGGGGATAGYGGLHGRRGRGCACPAIGFCLRTMVQERQPVHELRPGGSPPGDPRFCADECRKGGVASTALHGLSLSVGRDRDSTSVFFTVSNNLPFCRPPPAVNARALVRSAGRRGGFIPLRMCTRHVEGDGGKDYHATLFANGGLPRWEDRFVLREGPRDASSATNRQAAWAKSPIRSAVLQLTVDLSTCVLVLTSDLLPTGPRFLGMS